MLTTSSPIQRFLVFKRFGLLLCIHIFKKSEHSFSFMDDKTVKNEFKLKASKEPEKHYAVAVLKKEGFKRHTCTQCGTHFWHVSETKVCGNPECSGGFRFIDAPPTKKRLDYLGVWKTFSQLFTKLGYTPIPRYPVVARWRKDTDFVQASIYNFQPYVVSGEVEPPANPLVVPQFCLRFNDVDNVGITGSHYTGFVMIGQHAFMPPERFDQARYFSDIHTWLTKGLALPVEEITYHEDAWAGGGNFGPSMEFFSRGLELGNQVYMSYEKTASGFKELNIKVLDMGMGHERNAWLTQGKTTSYETTFPTVMQKLFKATDIQYDPKIVRKFLPYAGYLNIDEVTNIDKQWARIAQWLKLDISELKSHIIPLSALYSVAEHTRSLLFALHDGGLPSNVGGGYNLRTILRRALSFIHLYRWDLNLTEICKWHAAYLKPLYPELSQHLDDVHNILEVEKEKYKATQEKARHLVAYLLKEQITEDALLHFYDSQGISPELVREEGAKMGKRVTIPDDFYARVAELHEKKLQVHATKKEITLHLPGIPETTARYFEDYEKTEFDATVVGQQGNYLFLDQTCFYPTSGGQLHDLGVLGKVRVVDVFKSGLYIVHVLEKEVSFPVGQKIHGSIDRDRRYQLAQHHTTAHILSAAARRILGNHVNQASAYKDMNKARLDITHYQSLTPEEIIAIEKEANRIVADKIALRLRFESRTDAEKKYGVSIYQGGVVPGKKLRIVEIPEVDVEACGGTHLKNTSEAGKIKILKTSKISDGIVRLEYVAGKAAIAYEEKEKNQLTQVAQLLHVPKDNVPARAQEIFDIWKDVIKKGKDRKVHFISDAVSRGNDKEILEETAFLLKTQIEHVSTTLQRFLKELEEKKKK